MRVFRILVVLTLALAPVVIGRPSTAAVGTEFAPVADSYVSAKAPTTNFGTADRMRADATPVLRSYLRFAVTGLTGSVSTATLKLFSHTQNSVGYEVRAGAGGWTETGLTYSNAPPAGALLGSSGPLTSGSWVSVDITSFVTGDGVVDLVLTTTSANPAIALSTREHASRAPKLIVVADTTTTTLESSTTTTTGGSPGDAVLVATGDIACEPEASNFNHGLGTATACRQKDTSDLALAIGPDRVAALGDTQYDSAAGAAYLASYDLSWGRLKAITRPAVGNHEYLVSTSASGYFSYFPVAGAPTGYYSYDLGTWHVVVLNSNCNIVACSAGSAQEQWLRDDLAANSTACTVAYFHHPLFTSGSSHPGAVAVRPLWQALVAQGVDVVLNGHNHGYERFDLQDANGVAGPAGIREFVVGTGGKSLAGFGPVQPNSEVRSAAYGVLQLTLHGASYSWRFVSVAGSSFSDSGSEDCH
jgi:calcineurin-like phosphoesterase family protein